MPEAPLRHTEEGLVADGDGWFVVNARAARWRNEGPLGHYCNFEGERSFPQFGINLNVLEPGQPMAMYHREPAQEGFLVLSGECVLVVEGAERRLVQWDFFHCPPETDHVIVGAGAGAVVLAVGARGPELDGTVYPVSEVAARQGASVERETTEPGVAYAEILARLPEDRFTAYGGWLP
jgi:uncharacterized cupin superfamily protein